MVKSRVPFWKQCAGAFAGAVLSWSLYGAYTILDATLSSLMAEKPEDVTQEDSSVLEIDLRGMTIGSPSEKQKHVVARARRILEKGE